MKPDPYAALRHRPYRNFIIARAIFLIGSQMQAAAVAWQIYERLESKMALAFVGLVQIVPVLVLALPFGHLADRHDRKRIVLVGQALFLLASVGLAAVSFLNANPLFIYGFLLLLAVARALSMPALGALVVSLIPKEAWASGTSWNSTVFELTGMVGPALAGLVIAAFGGATATYLIAAACSLACLTFFLFLKPVQQPAYQRSAGLRDVFGGLRFVWRTKLLLSVMSLDLFAVLLGGAVALLPVMAKDVLQVGPAGFGWLRAAPSLGAIVMAILGAHLPPWRRSGMVLLLAVFGFGASMIGFGLSRHFLLSFTLLALGGVFDNLNVVIRQTLVQFITPDEMRGRVTSVNFLFIGCSNELGAFESGLAAQWLGTVPAVITGGIGTILVVVLIGALFPQLRQLGALHSIQPAPAQ